MYCCPGTGTGKLRSRRQRRPDKHPDIFQPRRLRSLRSTPDGYVPDNITLVPLPPYSPERNPVENIWGYLRGNKLANTDFKTYDEIVYKACAAWMFVANDKDRVASITSRD